MGKSTTLLDQLSNPNRERTRKQSVGVPLDPADRERLQNLSESTDQSQARIMRFALQRLFDSLDNEGGKSTNGDDAPATPAKSKGKGKK